MALAPRDSACEDLTTEDNRTPITLGMRLFNYYDCEWVTVTEMPTAWSRGWFEVTNDNGKSYSLNGVRVSTREPDWYKRDNRMTTVIYSCGHNLVGYLPESNPYVTTDWQSAHDSLVDDIVQHRDSLYDALKTHAYFESGRENWNMERILAFAEEYEDGFPVYVMDGQWRTVLMTDSDKAVITEIDQCDKALQWIGFNVVDNPGMTFSVSIGYVHYWLETVDRDTIEIPEDLEGDELQERIEQINERY